MLFKFFEDDPQHLLVRRAELFYVSVLRILIGPSETTSLQIVGWFRYRDPHRFDLIKEYFLRSLNIGSFGTKGPVGLYILCSEPTEPCPTLGKMITQMLFQATVECLILPSTCLPKVHQLKLFVIECVEAHLIPEIDKCSPP